MHPRPCGLQGHVAWQALMGGGCFAHCCIGVLDRSLFSDHSPGKVRCMLPPSRILFRVPKWASRHPLDAERLAEAAQAIFNAHLPPLSMQLTNLLIWPVPLLSRYAGPTLRHARRPFRGRRTVFQLRGLAGMAATLKARSGLWRGLGTWLFLCVDGFGGIREEIDDEGVARAASCVVLFEGGGGDARRRFARPQGRGLPSRSGSMRRHLFVL